MNNFEKILRNTKKRMRDVENENMTLSAIYDSILDIYPKFYTQEQSIYNCYRKVIINEISSFYDSQFLDELDMIKSILSRMIKECR